jgi:hypothetical protein
VSSGESGTRSADPAVPGQRGEDEQRAAHGDRGSRDRATDGRPSGERATDDSEMLPSHDSTGQPGPRRARARWRDLSRSALRKEPTPPPEELGEEAYWSYLRGDRPPFEDDAEQRASRAESPPVRGDVRETPVGHSRTADGPQSRQTPPLTEPARPTTEVAQLIEAAQPMTEMARPITEMAAPTTEVAPPETTAAQPQITATDPATGQEPVLDVERPPAWRTLIGSSRRERVLPGIARPMALTVLVALGWLAVVTYGVFRLDLLWSLGALAAGGVALALGLRGRSVIGLAPVLVGAAAWGMATGGQVPASPSDLIGDLRLIGWNALYAVPLLIAYGLATWLDAAGAARDRVGAALGGRRWWGAADVPDAEPRITALEAVPSARFFQLPSGSSPHLVTAGRRVALVRSAVWPRGAYTVAETGEVHRNGRVFAHGSDDLSGAVADVGTWAERLGTVTPAVVGFLVVYPASDRPGDKVDLDISQTGGVRVINAEEFVAVVGDFLAAEPYRLDVALTERIGEHLPVFEAQAG